MTYTWNIPEPKPVTLPRLRFLAGPVEPDYPSYSTEGVDYVLAVRRRLDSDARRYRRPGETLADAQSRLARGRVPQLPMDNYQPSMSRGRSKLVRMMSR